jgi:Winged helix-turn helix
VETPGKGGRRSEYLTLEEERDFLRPYFERAAKGEIATVAQIKQDFEQKIGHAVHKTTIYRLLDRHEWRKLVPRPAHPKGNKEEQEHGYRSIFLKWLKRR